MDAHYFIYEAGDGMSGGCMNGNRYLFFPEKEILIAFSPLFGEFGNIKESKTGYFDTNIKSLSWAREVVKTKGNPEEGIKYFGKINLPDYNAEDIIFLHKKYTSDLTTISQRKALGEVSKKSIKNLENLVKEKFPESFGQEPL